LTKEQINTVYASEADLLNVALFGKTALQCRKENPKAKGNIRDDARLEQVVVLSNLESINAGKACRKRKACNLKSNGNNAVKIFNRK
jgi:hypothetical protein